MTKTDYELFSDLSWRMNHLYRIIDKNGNSIPFKLNAVQQHVLDNLHNRNLCLKARQLGMSTFSVIYMLDKALFVPNSSCGIVSYSLEHAQHIFKRIIGHSLDTLYKDIQRAIPIKQRSAREIVFGNGSFIRVDTTLRGGTCRHVLVSEFGKTCARNPVKAEEVITGTLQSVPIDGTVIIESTGEGNEGYYADMVNQAVIHKNEDLSELEYKLFFFPWIAESTYKMQKRMNYEVELTDYFDKLETELNTTITQEQRNWYAFQRLTLGDKIRQEFPSTVSEAFISSSDAYYFQQGIEKAHKENRIINNNLYDALEPVYVAMDIGVNDLTVIVFFQVIHGEIRIIDYYKDNNKGADFYCKFLLNEKPYIYRTIYLPHDARKRDGVIVENTWQREFTKHFSHAGTHVVVLKKTDEAINISNAKIKLDRCVFNLLKTKELISYLSKFRKKWSEQYGKYLDEYYHDTSSHYAFGFIYAMQAVNKIEALGSTDNALEEHRKAVDARRNFI